MNADAISLILKCIQDKRYDVMSLEDWMHYVDKIELQMANGELGDCYIKHRFADGMYLREAFMPAGSIAVSNIHNTTHPLVVLDGKLAVRTHLGSKIFTTGHLEITKPMTRRILYALLDTRFITFHALPDTDVAEIQKKILVKRQNPLLSNIQLLKIAEHVDRSNTL